MGPFRFDHKKDLTYWSFTSDIKFFYDSFCMFEEWANSDLTKEFNFMRKNDTFWLILESNPNQYHFSAFFINLY